MSALTHSKCYLLHNDCQCVRVKVDQRFLFLGTHATVLEATYKAEELLMDFVLNKLKLTFYIKDGIRINQLHFDIFNANKLRAD
jgi:hypothetical protein